jgi:hypothetical protein
MAAKIMLACDQSTAECSISNVNQSNPIRAKTLVANKSPNDSHVPKDGWPLRSFCFTGFALIDRSFPLYGRKFHAEAQSSQSFL